MKDTEAEPVHVVVQRSEIVDIEHHRRATEGFNGRTRAGREEGPHKP